MTAGAQVRRFIGCRNDWRIGEYPKEFVECCRLRHRVKSRKGEGRSRVYSCAICGIEYKFDLEREVAR